MTKYVTIFPHWAPSFKVVSRYVYRALKEWSYKPYIADSTRYFFYSVNIIKRHLFRRGTVILIGNFRDLPWFLKYLLLARPFSPNIVFYGVVEGPLSKTTRNTYSMLDRVIVASKYGAQRLWELRVKTDAIIPHAIDVTEFEDACRRKDVKKQDNKVTLLSVISALVPRKGLTIYFRALKTLLDKKPTLANKITVVLKVPEAIEIPPELKKIITLISGWLDRSSLIKLYCDADIVVIPSLNEGFSIPIIEAFAAGKPVISLDAPPMNELNSDRCGWLIKVRRSRIIGDHECFIPDIDDFAEKLLDAIESDDKRNEYSVKVANIRWRYHYQLCYKPLQYLV
jgi:glycosyltransferase involved in cell wall biosynthesis